MKNSTIDNQEWKIPTRTTMAERIAAAKKYFSAEVKRHSWQYFSSVPIALSQEQWCERYSHLNVLQRKFRLSNCARRVVGDYTLRFLKTHIANGKAEDERSKGERAEVQLTLPGFTA